MTEPGCDVEDIRRRISGIEIDRRLAVLAEALLCDRLGETYADDGAETLIRIGDSLAVGRVGSYDAVFVNPPYGRVLGLPGEVPPEWLANGHDRSKRKSRSSDCACERGEVWFRHCARPGCSNF